MPCTRPTFIGVEIGGTKLQVVLGDGAGNVIRRWRNVADREGGGTRICQQISQGIREVRAGMEPCAIGVGFGGPVDRATARISRSHQVHGWEDFPLRDWLAEETGLPVVVENDANCGALGEATRGAGAGFDPVFYVTLGSGVGGGLIADGSIYHGAAPGEAEFGHLRLDRSGATVESRCSGWAIDRRIREIKASRPDSVLARSLGSKPGGEAKHLPVAVSAGDPAAHEILRELADDLAFALSHVTHLFHPQVIVLGGGLSLVGEPLRAAVAEALPKYVMEAFSPGPLVRLAALGENAVPVGAIELATRHRRSCP
jgi:glucokinase